MKRFIIKSIIFALPLCLFFVEGFLPLNTFSYRPWEALHYSPRDKVAYPFYPNQTIEMQSYGDLCYHSKNQIKKYENWKTDALGFRNDTLIKNPNILLIGDSFIVGSSIRQDSTLSNLLRQKLQTKVYNLAPSNFNEFVSLIENKVIDKPEVVIFSSVERFLPPHALEERVANFTTNNDNTQIFIDRVKRFYLLEYLKSRIRQRTGPGIKGTSNMFFLNNTAQTHNNKQLEEVVETIVSYKTYCDAMNVDFIFLPLPDKETLYYNLVPLESQPDFLFKLDTMLQAKGVKTINSLKLLNLEKSKRKDYLYHLDDTHWNSKGVNVVANGIANALKP